MPARAETAEPTGGPSPGQSPGHSPGHSPGPSPGPGSEPTFDVVCTTIGDGEFLKHYADLVDRTGAGNRVRMVVIPDRRTPRQLYTAVEEARAQGLRVLCPGLDEQVAFTEAIGAGSLVPWDTDNRRNLGYLLSLRDGADVVVSIDDDNLAAGEDFFTAHAAVVAPAAVTNVIETDRGWFNVCDLLDVDPAPVWARGFPYRHRVASRTRAVSEPATVRVNAGLWTGEPDVDAITRLGARPEAHGLRAAATVLGPATWTPINSQNTALAREAIPAYYFVRMGHRVDGRRLDRYADIFSGYFVQACAKRLGHRVRVGTPLVEHTRNQHDLLADLRVEHPVIDVLDELLDWLTGATPALSGSGYGEVYASLSLALQDAVEDLDGPGWNDAVRGFFHRMAHHMRHWLALCDRVTGTS